MRAAAASLARASVTMWRGPLFAVLPAVALGLGLASLTAALTLVDTLLWRAPVWPTSGSIAIYGARYTADPVRSASPRFVAAMDGLPGVLSRGVAGVPGPVNVILGDSRWLLHAQPVDATFLTTLGIVTSPGRPPGRVQGVTVSYDFWQRQMGAAADATTRSLRVDGRDLPVTGILPRGYRFFSDVDLLLPLPPVSVAGDVADNLTAVARLAPGASLHELATAVALRTAAHAGGLEIEPAALPMYGAGSLDDALTYASRHALLALLGAAGLVVAVAGINVSNLMLSRAMARSRDMAIRLVMGAPCSVTWSLALGDALVIGLLAAALGMPTGAFCVTAFADLIPAAWRTSSLPLETCGRVYLWVGAADAMVVLTGALAAATVHDRTGDLLRERVGAPGGDFRDMASRQLGIGMLVLQGALAAFLLCHAAIALDGFVTARHQGPKFATRDRWFAQVHPDTANYPTRASVERLMQQVMPIGGFASLLPEGASFVMPFLGHDGSRQFVQFGLMTPGAADATGLRMTAGRWFDADDRDGSPPVAVVNAAFMAQMHVGVGDLARPDYQAGNPLPLRIVGTVADTRQADEEGRAVATVYMPLAQMPEATFALMRQLAPLYAVWRHPGSEAANRRAFLVPWYAGALSLGAGPVKRLSTLDEIARAAPRSQAALLSALAAAALFLAMVSAFASQSLKVSASRRDLGIRLALGSPRHVLVSGVIAAPFACVMSGGGLGLAAAVMFARSHGETQGLAWMPALVAMPVFAFAIAAALAVPAWRAATTDPLPIIHGH